MVEGRQRPLRTSNTVSVWEALSEMIGAPMAADEMAKAYKKTQQYCEELGKSLVQTSANFTKQMSRNTAEALDILNEAFHPEIAIKKQREAIDKEINRVRDVLGMVHTTQEEFNKKNPLPSIKAPKADKIEDAKVKDLVGHPSMKGLMGFLSEGTTSGIMSALSGIFSQLTKLAPQILVLGSLGGMLLAVIRRVFELDTILTQLSMTYGGDMPAMIEYNDKLGAIVKTTNASKQELMEWTAAFQQAGLPIVRNLEGLSSYLEKAIDLNKILGTSQTELAKYTRTLHQSGQTAEDIWNSYDQMYQMMQRSGLTLTDLNKSLSEGDAMWSQFGYVSGRALDQLQSDVLSTRGVFSAFNVEVKDVGALIGSIWGDPKTHMKQAAFISAMTGISGAKAFNLLGDNSPEYMQRMAESVVKQATMMDPTVGMTDAQIKAKYSDSDRMAQSFNRHNMQAGMEKSYGPAASQAITSQYLSDFTAFRKANPAGSVADWSKRRMEEGQFTGKIGTLSNAKGTMELSMAETAKKTGNMINLIVDYMAYFVLRALPPIMGAANKFLNFLGTNGVESFDKFQKDRENFITSKEAAAGAPVRLRGGISEEDSYPMNDPGVRKARARGLADLHKLQAQERGGGNDETLYAFPNAGRGTGTNAGIIKQAMQFWQQQPGFNKNMAAGMVGNMMAESGGRTGAHGDKNLRDSAHGVFQWRGSRFEALKKFAHDRGTSWDDRETQYRFANKELRDRGDFKKLRTAGSATEATNIVQDRFEIPALKSFHPGGSRARFGQLALKHAGDGGGTHIPPPIEGEKVSLLKEQNKLLHSLLKATTDNHNKVEKRLAEIALHNKADNPGARMQQMYVHNNIA